MICASESRSSHRDSWCKVPCSKCKTGTSCLETDVCGLCFLLSNKLSCLICSVLLTIRVDVTLNDEGSLLAHTLIVSTIKLLRETADGDLCKPDRMEPFSCESAYLMKLHLLVLCILHLYGVSGFGWRLNDMWCPSCRQPTRAENYVNQHPLLTAQRTEEPKPQMISWIYWPGVQYLWTHSLHSIHYDDGPVTQTHSGGHLGGEVHVTGGVDQVQQVLLVPWAQNHVSLQVHASHPALIFIRNTKIYSRNWKTPYKGKKRVTKVNKAFDVLIE